jgi:Zn-dependent metalloprotease
MKKMKQKNIILLLLLCCGSLRVNAQRNVLSAEQKSKYDSLRQQMPKLKLNWNTDANTPSAISNIKTGVIAADSIEIKSYFLQQFGIFYSIKDSGDIRVGSPRSAGKGFKKAVAMQLYKGVPVYGGVLNFNFNDNNQLLSISGKWAAISDRNPSPDITAAQALQRVKEYIERTKLKGRKIPDTLTFTANKSELMFFNPAAYFSGSGKKNDLHLVYYLEIKTEVFFVDARSGVVMVNFSRINDARVRETYSQSPACRGLPGTLVLNETGVVGGAVPDAQATNAHNFAGTVYDYYFNTHGRDSYNGTGGTIRSSVHGMPPTDLFTILCCALGGTACCCNQVNAVWHPTLLQMIYGDGGTSGVQSYRAFTDGLDVLAHELTHAVTQFSVLDVGGMPHGLDYNGESGAMNEACSDIFAAMVDRADWRIGEDIVLTGFPSGSMRNMADPTNGGAYNPADAVNSVRQGNQPHHYNNRYTGAEDNGGVHINSGIINHMAFLLSDGGTHSFSHITVNGIGKNALEKIMYRTLNGHLTPTSNFLDMRRAALVATEEVFPGDAAKYASVWNAFLAVGICDPAIPGDCSPYAPIESRDPVTIALALDYSGSMNDAAEPGGRPKVEVLKDAVEIFLRTWEIFSIPGDRAGVVSFSSDVLPTSLVLQPLASNVNSIVSTVRARPADGFTAMGGALRVSLDGLSSTSHPAAILFTNGMQNVNPMSLRSGGTTGNYQIINGTSAQAYGGNSSISPNPGVDISAYGIPVHVIAIGRAVGDAYHTLLNDIRSETGGLLHITNTPDMALREFYLNDLVHALSLNTIEMIDYRYTGIPQGGGLNESFDLDKGVNRAAFMVSWTGDAQQVIRNFRIQAPDGSIITPTRWVNGTFYSIAVFDFPYMNKIVAVSPIGRWRIFTADSINGAMNLQVSLIVDEKEIHYQFKAKSPTHWAGDPLQLSSLVTGELQEPLSGLSDVSVTVNKPKKPLGHILAKTPGSGAGIITEDLPNAATIKLKYILGNNAVRTQLLPDIRKTRLMDDGSNGDSSPGDGLYEYRYTNTNEPGLYQFTFRVKGNAPGYGVIERNKTISVILRNKPSIIKSILTKELMKGGNNNAYRLTITPIDANGYYLGPGYASDILLMADGRNITDIKDKLDGTYEAVIQTAPGQPDVQVIINASGITLYNGAVAQLGSPEKKWSLSVHGGIAAPLGKFDNNYNAGWLGEVDLEYRLQPSFSIEVVGGYYAFASKGIISNTSITGITLYGKKIITPGAVSVYVAAGPGYYKPKSVSGVLGGSAAIGLQKSLSSRVIGEIGAAWFALTGSSSNIQFGAARIGLHIRL